MRIIWYILIAGVIETIWRSWQARLSEDWTDEATGPERW